MLNREKSQKEIKTYFRHSKYSNKEEMELIQRM